MSTRIQAGKLRHKVQIQRNSGEGTYGDHGETTENWVKDYDAWAEIKTLTGRELELARQVYPTATHQITMRFDSRLGNTRHRIAHGPKAFNIDHIEDVDQRNIVHVCLCGEYVGEAA